ncbi:MAG: prepilin-type N-terminal cleavage/methylation domain-containing protein [bacterium]
MNRIFSGNSKGFTLIELLIVVAIIGILAAIAVPNFMNARLRTQITRAKAELKSVGDAYLMYHMDTSGWPPHLDGYPGQHRYVTSPVAYLSTSISDPFQPPPATQHSVSLGQYHCEPATVQQGRYKARYPSVYNQLWNAAYIPWSYGPDQDHEGDNWYIYDMSNGLISNGDLDYYVYGMNNGKFPFNRH